MLFLLSSSYPPYSFKAHICLKPGANVDLWPLYKASCFVLHHQSLLSFPLILAVTAYYTISSLQFTLHPILPLNLFSAHYIYLSPPLCPLCFLKSRYQLSSSLGASSPLLISTYMLILFLFHCSGGGGSCVLLIMQDDGAHIAGEVATGVLFILDSSQQCWITQCMSVYVFAYRNGMEDQTCQKKERLWLCWFHLELSSFSAELWHILNGLLVIQ